MDLFWPEALSIAEGMKYQRGQILARITHKRYRRVHFVDKFKEHPGAKKSLVRFCMTCTSNPDDIDSLCPPCAVADFQWRWKLKSVNDHLALLQNWQAIVATGDRILGKRSWQLMDINVKIRWLRERKNWIESRVADYLNEIAVLKVLKQPCSVSKHETKHKCDQECDMEVIVEDAGEMRIMSGEELGPRRMEFAMTGWQAGRRAKRLPKY